MKERERESAQMFLACIYTYICVKATHVFLLWRDKPRVLGGLIKIARAGWVCRQVEASETFTRLHSRANSQQSQRESKGKEENEG